MEEVEVVVLYGGSVPYRRCALCRSVLYGGEYCIEEVYHTERSALYRSVLYVGEYCIEGALTLHPPAK
jgi:hypothetical protein